MISSRVAGVIWLLGGIVYLVCEAVAAAGFPDYSYLYNYISDLGGSAVMNLGAFVTHGVLLLLGAVIVTRGLSLGRLGHGLVFAAAVNAAGNVMIAIVPSASPHAVPWHGIGAALAILGGNAAVILGGLCSRWSDHRRVSIVLGIVGFGCVIALVLGVQPAGLVERGSVYTIIAWELLTGVVLLRRCRDERSGQRG